MCGVDHKQIQAPLGIANFQAPPTGNGACTQNVRRDAIDRLNRSIGSNAPACSLHLNLSFRSVWGSALCSTEEQPTSAVVPSHAHALSLIKPHHACVLVTDRSIDPRLFCEVHFDHQRPLLATDSNRQQQSRSGPSTTNTHITSRRMATPGPQLPQLPPQRWLQTSEINVRALRLPD